MAIMNDINDYIATHPLKDWSLDNSSEEIQNRLNEGYTRIIYKIIPSIEGNNEQIGIDLKRLIKGMVDHPYANLSLEDTCDYSYDENSVSFLVKFNDEATVSKEEILRSLSTYIPSHYLIAQTNTELSVFRDGRDSIKSKDILMEYYVSKNESNDGYNLNIEIIDNDPTSKYYVEDKQVLPKDIDDSNKPHLPLIYMENIQREDLQNLGVSNSEIDSLEEGRDEEELEVG